MHREKMVEQIEHAKVLKQWKISSKFIPMGILKFVILPWDTLYQIFIAIDSQIGAKHIKISIPPLSKLPGTSGPVRPVYGLR